MRILVFGAGAVGSFLGGMLAARDEVTLVGRSSHIEAIGRSGLRISGLSNSVARPRGETDVPPGPFDMVMLTVKSYDLETAMDAVRPKLGEGTVLLVIQNGVRITELPGWVAGSKVFLGVASFGVTHLGPGEVRYAGRGKILIGALKGGGDPMPLVNLFEMSGVEAEVSVDIVREAWRKAVINSAVNPITALVRRPNGHLLESPELLWLSQELFEESLRVAMAAGALSEGELDFQAVESLLKATALNHSSMLQDVERGRRTEVDAINGTFVKLGAHLGLEVTYNRAVCTLIHGLEGR